MNDDIRGAYVAVFRSSTGKRVLADLEARLEAARIASKPGGGLNKNPDFYFGMSEMLDYINKQLTEPKPDEIARQRDADRDDWTDQHDSGWTERDQEVRVPAKPVHAPKARRAKRVAS